MATPNYGYEKRQRELAKKKKKEDKLREKALRKNDAAPDEEPAAGADHADGPLNSAPDGGAEMPA